MDIHIKCALCKLTAREKYTKEVNDGNKICSSCLLMARVNLIDKDISLNDYVDSQIVAEQLGENCV